MPERNGLRLTTRSAGMLAALGLAGVSLVIVLWFVLSGPSRSETDTTVEDDVPNIADLMSANTRGATAEGPSASGMYIELADRNDPGSFVGVITAESAEPISDLERRVIRPRAWRYLDNGVVAHIEADVGEFRMPDPTSAPESGRLEGNVRIRLYRPPPGRRAPRIDTDLPILTSVTDQPLLFDFKLGQITTGGRMLVTTDEIEFAGSGVTAVINRVQSRLELLEVARGEFLRYLPRRPEDAPATAAATTPATTDDATPVASSSTSTGATSAAPATSNAGQPTTVAQAGPRIDLYRVNFFDGVQVERETQRIRGDRLDLWLRLEDNQIPAGAIAGANLGNDGAQEHAPDASPAPTTTDPDAPRSLFAATSPATPSGNDPLDAVASTNTPATTTAAAPASDPYAPIELTWTGRLTINPLPDTPDELRDDDMALRMTAEHAGLVRFADDTSGANGACVELAYGLTRGSLVMSGPGGRVDVELPGSGSIDCSRLVAGLTTGLVHVRGPGLLSLDAPSDDAGRRRTQRIGWAGQADFEFELAEGRISSEIRSASLLDDVEAIDDRASLTGSALDAIFVAAGESNRRLAQLNVTDARADDGREGSLSASELEVHFGEGTQGEEMDPTRLIAIGGVRGTRGEDLLQAGALDAALARDEDGDVIVTEVDARGAVRYTGADRTTAAGESLAGDAITQQLRLRGEGSQVGRGGALIAGEDVFIDGVRRQAVVRGPGTFTFEGEPDETGHRHTVDASWTSGMRFDDFEGSVICEGGVKAVSNPDALASDTIEASIVRIALSPVSLGEDGLIDDADRQLVSATAIGSGGAPARVESRSYAADPIAESGRVLAQLYYIEGAQVNADNVAQTLDVPTAGKLMLLDRRAGDDARTPVSQPGASGLDDGGPAQALFEWTGTMHMDRATGTSVMREGVVALHKNLLTGVVTELEAERLAAQIRETGLDPTESSGGAGELIRAEASGAVYFASGPRELLADRVVYDAVRGIALATASPGNLITIFDAENPTPVNARSMSWDIASDLVRVDTSGGFGGGR